MSLQPGRAQAALRPGIGKAGKAKSSATRAKKTSFVGRNKGTKNPTGKKSKGRLHDQKIGFKGISSKQITKGQASMGGAAVGGSMY